MTTNTPSQDASIDTREFRLLLADLCEASEFGPDEYAKARAPFIAYIDAKLAQAREEAALDREAHLMNSHMELMDAASAKHRIKKAEADRDEWHSRAEDFEHLARMASVNARKYQVRADTNEGMAESMAMFRRDMIEAGVIGKSVPPMFMTEAILGAIGKERARAECAEECFAKLTASDNEWRDRANVLEARLGEVMETRDELQASATAAESRLAEIQLGLEEIIMLTDSEMRDGDTAREKAERMLSLLQPQGQADTSGLPG